MPLFLPILLCLAGLVVAALPSEDFAPPPPQRGSWIAMLLASCAVAAFVLIVVSRLGAPPAPVARTTPACPTVPAPTEDHALGMLEPAAAVTVLSSR